MLEWLWLLEQIGPAPLLLLLVLWGLTSGRIRLGQDVEPRRRWWQERITSAEQTGQAPYRGPALSAFVAGQAGGAGNGLAATTRGMGVDG